MLLAVIVLSLETYAMVLKLLQPCTSTWISADARKIQKGEWRPVCLKGRFVGVQKDCMPSCTRVKST